MWVIGLAAIGLAVLVVPAQAEIVTRCGASAGTAYFFAGGMVPANEAGWTKDGISGGEISFLKDGRGPDIVYTDSAGSRSARADGGEIIELGSGPTTGTLVYLAYYPVGVAEHYFFRLDTKGNGEVVWGSLKWMNKVDKSALYHASCSASK